VFEHVCKFGLEGIMSKRKVSHYESGRSAYWIKLKNPEREAARRAAEWR
jgi:ATP-dependent DNA ligase